MPLAAVERAWLAVQVVDMKAAAAKAQVYASGLSLYEDQQSTTRWWRLWRRYRGGVRLARKHRLHHDEALRLAAVIQAWVAAHQITTGSERGPFIPPDIGGEVRRGVGR